MTAPTTVPLADLEANVPDGVGIDMPGPEGGWAVAVIGGRVYRARVAAVPVEDMAHDTFARECVEVGAPLETLHDGPCPACRAMSAVIDLDPDYGPAEDGRPYIGPADRRRTP